MRIWGRKALEDEYDDLTNCTLDAAAMSYGETYESIIDLAGTPNINVLWRKERVYLEILKKKRVERILMAIPKLIGGLLQALIPKDEFDGRYKK
jgi:hypothetical protein|tara:strand:+ start:3115 stop:3396 length:282 start_codon:yes stop_codon:yes gene_type:complete